MWKYQKYCREQSEEEEEEEKPDLFCQSTEKSKNGNDKCDNSMDFVAAGISGAIIGLSYVV